VRVYESKLIEFGIPPEELGFQPTDNNSNTTPAGLVSAWELIKKSQIKFKNNINLKNEENIRIRKKENS